MKVLEVFLLLEMTSILQVNSWTPYPVNCQWNSYGPWSECDGCSKTQTRRRTVVVYGQYGGNPCSGSAFETQPCVPVVGCPVEEGCGNRFRCFSGQCIRKTLVCNGDSDCENDSSDEDQCEDRKTVCDIDKVPLNAELTGAGFNLITGEFKKNVIHTKSFGGTCRKVFSGDRPEYYRLSESMLAYTFQVEIKNDFSYEFYNSKWSYVKVTERQVSTNYQESEYKYQTFTEDKEKSYQLMVIKNDVEVAQFLNNAPEVLPLAESFWKELANLPAVYDYNAYRRLIDNYGTHFLQSGSLGGEYKVIFYVDTEKMKEEGISIHDMNKCSTSSRGFLFFKKTTTKCQKIHNVFRSSSGSSSQEIHGDAFILGGEPKFVAGLSYLDLDNPAGNEARYASWAGSVKKVPSVIKQKITPLYELVKEVPCASVKKYYLKQAIQEYLTETDPCKCRPCQSNGQPVLMGTQCQCLCRPYTFGEACERGVLVEDQPGVIDGSWSCWSSWSSCVTERRSRSRSCSNPHPSGGGKSCIGENFENQQCDNEDLKHLRMIEPHCFDTSVIPTEFCTPPPALENGFVQDSGPFYPVGRAVVYSCTDGYALLGDPVAKCGEDMKWHIGNMQCKRIACTFPALQANVRGAPRNSSYQIGEKVTLSCPAGMRLEGAAIILCESSLKWSPDVKEIQCKSESPTEVPKPAGPTCQPWEKLQQSKCTCKMPYECGSSLDICAVDAKNNKNVALTVCKMHALECLGRKYTLTDQDTCTIPAVAEHSCDGCHLWEKCDDQTNRCVCREERVCKDGGISVCIQVNGEITKQTMSECEAGILKCQGQNITIVSIRPCDM